MAGVTAILSEVSARLGNRTDVSSRALVWLNDAYFELLLSPRFDFFELDGSATFSTVASTATYSLTTVASTLWFLLDVVDTTTERRLERVHVRTLDEITTTAGLPVRYARFGAVLQLDPVPDQVVTIRIRYRARPSELVSGGSHLLGREWDEVLTALAVLKGREALEQTEQAAMQRQLVESLMAAREEVLSLEDADAETRIGVDLTGGY